MTTAYQIIVDAYRQSNLIGLGVEPTKSQEDEALRYLNRIVSSVYGNEVGDPLEAVLIGHNNIDRPSGYPWWDPSSDGYWYLPIDARVMANLSETGKKIFLNPFPRDGSRFSVVDASKNFSTYPLEIVGNGNMIDGAFSVSLDVDGFSGDWMYREDLATWVKSHPLTIFDEMPFPVEFDDFFILLLAFRLNPAYQRTLDPQSVTVLNRAKTQIRARYRQDIMTPSEVALLRRSRVSADRDYWMQEYGRIDTTYLFNRGRPY